jgi:raffinose/stachyose/melibiose transport system permease protein
VIDTAQVGSPQAPSRQTVDTKKKSNLRMVWDARFLYLLIFPTIGLLLVFNYAPILMGIYISFTRFDGVRAFWIGIENYVRIFKDPALVQSYKNMAIILPFSIIVGVTVPMFVAYLIYHLRHTTTRYWFRVLFTVPMVVPTIVTLLIWIFMYTPSGGVNSILDALGLHQLTLTPDGQIRSWLGDQRTALAAILFVGFPWVAPVNMLIFLAGLEAIEVELIDAAKVDGATGWKMFWNIELPMVMGQVRLIVVTSSIGVMQGFQQILVMTSGGPGYATMVPAMRMYDTVFNIGAGGSAPQMGFGSAIGVMLFVVIMIITIFNLRVIRRVEPEALR